mmetsp:Transcript_19636/g.41035  ORF Transcript_19636/g.41035 Transcript_19636/m.41035 type:complete len:216 (+) Transcript_19636:1361-2008(+)
MGPLRDHPLNVTSPKEGVLHFVLIFRRLVRLYEKQQSLNVPDKNLNARGVDAFLVLFVEIAQRLLERLGGLVEHAQLGVQPRHVITQGDVVGHVPQGVVVIILSLAVVMGRDQGLPDLSCKSGVLGVVTKGILKGLDGRFRGLDAHVSLSEKNIGSRRLLRLDQLKVALSEGLLVVPVLEVDIRFGDNGMGVQRRLGSHGGEHVDRRSEVVLLDG